MLTARLNTSFKIVSYHDPAFDEMDDIVLNKYIQTRDISILDIENLETQPTVFDCLPLQQEYEHLPQRVLTDSAGASWSIFKTHVQGAKDFLHTDGKQILKFKNNSEGIRILDDKCRKDISPSLVSEIAGVIVERASKGDYGPFLVSDTFARERIRLRARLAFNARSESVKA